jgi:hypothetical protein
MTPAPKLGPANCISAAKGWSGIWLKRCAAIRPAANAMAPLHNINWAIFMSAAAQEDANAQNGLARSYRHSLAVETDSEVGRTGYLKAADKSSSCPLQVYYPPVLGSPANSGLVKFLEQAAEDGVNISAAWLGHLFRAGNGI